jgi:hypothetical protein
MKQVSIFLNSFIPGNTPIAIISKMSSTRFMLILFPLFIFLFITGCKKNELPGNSQNDDLQSSILKKEGKTTCVPFKASFTTMDEITQVPTDSNPIQKDHITGTGVGTGIGRSTVDTYAAGDITLPFPALVTSTTTFIAANGDKIFATNDGYLQEPSANGDLQLGGNGTITGGTGRFAGATGNFKFAVTGNIFQPEGTVTFKGTICY